MLLALVSWVGGHPRLHGLVDLLLEHLTCAGVDVWLHAAHTAAKGRWVSWRDIQMVNL